MQKTYLQRWKQYLKENTHEAPDDIVHAKIDTFVDETIDRFMNLMNELNEELFQHGIPAGNHFREAELHFQQEMLALSAEIIDKIYEDQAFDASTHNTETDH